MQVKEIYNHWLPPLIGADAITFGNIILYGMPEDKVWSVLRKHEMVHVEQYAKYGVVRFLIIYIYEYLVGRLKGLDDKQAYRNIGFEKEAFEKQKL